MSWPTKINVLSLFSFIHIVCACLAGSLHVVAGHIYISLVGQEIN